MIQSQVTGFCLPPDRPPRIDGTTRLAFQRRQQPTSYLHATCRLQRVSIRLVSQQPRNSGLTSNRLPVTRGDIEDLLAERYAKGQVAKALGISKTTLYRRLKEKG